MPLEVLHSQWPSPVDDLEGLFISKHYYLKKKVMSVSDSNSKLSNGLRMETMKEIGILRALNSEHVMQLHGIYLREGWEKEADKIKASKDVQNRTPEDKPSFITLIFPRMRCNLRDYFDEIFKVRSGTTYPYGPEIIRSYAAQLLLALEHCHRRGVVHRDLRPENILLSDEGGLLKLGGFGNARSFVGVNRSQDETRPPTIVWYRAPEILLNYSKYTTQMDVWSAGLIFSEFFNDGDVLLPATNEVEQLMLIFRLRGTPTEATWPGVTSLQDFQSVSISWPGESLRKQLHSKHVTSQVLELLESVLTVSPVKRCSATAALGHSYFLNPVDNHPSPPAPVAPPQLNSKRKKAAPEAEEAEEEPEEEELLELQSKRRRSSRRRQ